MLLDTSGLLCHFDGADDDHEAAAEYLASAASLVTHNYVLAEFVALCQVRGFARVPVLQYLTRLLANPLIRVVWVDEELHQRAMTLLQQRADKQYSLCNAVSFVIMRDRRLTDALTTDKHFAQEGFQKLLRR